MLYFSMNIMIDKNRVNLVFKSRLRSPKGDLFLTGVYIIEIFLYELKIKMAYDRSFAEKQDK